MATHDHLQVALKELMRQIWTNPWIRQKEEQVPADNSALQVE